MTQEERENIEVQYERLQRIKAKEEDLKLLRWMVALLENSHPKFDYVKMVVDELGNEYNVSSLSRVCKEYLHMSDPIKKFIYSHLEEAVEQLEQEIERM